MILVHTSLVLVLLVSSSYAVELELASDAQSNSIPSGFCSSYVVPSGAALEIVSSTPDAAGFYYSHINRPLLDPATGTVSIPPLSASMYESWPIDLPQVGNVGPFVKNIGARSLVFSSTCAWKSPAASLSSCQSDPQTCFQTVLYNPFATSPLLWVKLVGISDCGPFIYPSLELATSDLPAAGTVRVALANQCQAYRYIAGTTVVKMTDEWGNKYIMHAVVSGSASDVDVSTISVPPNWSVKQSVLTDDLYVYPLQWSSSPDFCLYTLLLDNLGNGYHQYKYAERQVQITDEETTLFSVAAATEQCISTLEVAGLLIPSDDVDGDYITAPETV